MRENRCSNRKRAAIMLQHESKGHMRMVLFCESSKGRYLEPLQDEAFRIYNSIVLKLEEIIFVFFPVLSSESCALRKLLHPGSVTTCLLILAFTFRSFVSYDNCCNAQLQLIGARCAVAGASRESLDHYRHTEAC